MHIAVATVAWKVVWAIEVQPEPSLGKLHSSRHGENRSQAATLSVYTCGMVTCPRASTKFGTSLLVGAVRGLASGQHGRPHLALALQSELIDSTRSPEKPGAICMWHAGALRLAVHASDKLSYDAKYRIRY